MVTLYVGRTTLRDGKPCECNRTGQLQNRAEKDERLQGLATFNSFARIKDPSQLIYELFLLHLIGNRHQAGLGESAVRLEYHQIAIVLNTRPT